MLDIRNLSIVVGNKTLIDNLSFSVSKGDKLAIIGEEGNGKSTIAKAIACPSKIVNYATISGKINTFGQKIGYLEQILDSAWNDQSIENFFLKDLPEEEPDFEKYLRFNTIERYFDKFDLDNNLLDSMQCIGTLSGGEKIKLQLIKVLSENPDILILDEPTNDLDIKTLEWIEEFILEYEKPIIYISHDEQLLEKTANAILHVEQLKRKTQNKCTFVHMGYKEYVEQRLFNLDKQRQVAEKEREEDRKQMERFRQIYSRVDHELNSVSRQDPHSGRLLKKKMKSVKSLEKRLERQREEFTEFPDTEEAIYLNFGENDLPSSKVVCDFAVNELKIKERLLAKNIKLKVVGAKKIVVVGNNGVGKSTFIKELVGFMSDRKDIKLGYMPQNYDDQFKNYNSVLEYVNENVYDKNELTKIRTFLGCLKFTENELNGKISELSGGQKAKLFIARLMAEKCNVLILDEPTRNLSPLSNPIIRQALNEYKGAIISISHDRKFIKDVANIVYEMTKDGLINVTDNFVE